MATTKPTDSTLTFIKVARALTYLVYGFTLIAIVFLVLGFILLLFGANTTVPFVQFVYNVAVQFLSPFRGIFPPVKINDTSYFSSAGLFAIVMYSIFAAAVHSLINYITLKEVTHEKELLEAQQELQSLQAKSSK